MYASELIDKALVSARFGMNWVGQAEHGGYYQAVASGFYEECGLRVEIVPGGVRTAGRKKLIMGELDFYVGGNMVVPFMTIQQGMSTKVVAAHFQKDPQVIMAHPGTFGTFESLKEARIFLNDGIFNSFFKLMIAEFGFSPAKRRPYNLISFMNDKKSVHQGIISSEPFAIERQAGFYPKLYLLSDFGLTSYASLIETTESMILQKPSVVQCFVDASAKGWYVYLYGDNKVANEAIKKDNPAVDDTDLQYAVAVMREYGVVDSGDALVYGIGAMTDQRMESFFNKLVDIGIVDASVDYKEAYTLKFVNKGVGLGLKKSLRE